MQKNNLEIGCKHFDDFGKLIFPNFLTKNFYPSKNVHFEIKVK